MNHVENASATPGMTAAALLDKLPRMTPVLTSLVEENPTTPRHFRLRNGMTFQSLPKLEWYQVFTAQEKAKAVAAEIVEV